MKEQLYKTCKKCKKNKSYSKFHKDKSKKDDLKSICGECENNRPRERRTNHKQNLKKLKDKLGGACSFCGYSNCYEALEFHHIDPENKMKISDKSGDVSIGKILWGYSFKKAEEEINKCILICANCHRELHANETKV